jgi:hypothetical protein
MLYVTNWQIQAMNERPCAVENYYICRMLTNARKAVVLGIALVFFFNTCVFGVLFTVELYWHRLDQLRSLNSGHGSIEQMIIPAEVAEGSSPDFFWKKNWEFSYYGEMYDVVSSRKTGDKYVMLVKHDTKEEKLLRKAQRQAEQERKSREEQAKKNLKVNLIIASDNETSLPVLVYSEREIPQRQPLICESHRTLPDPPPWIG